MSIEQKLTEAFKHNESSLDCPPSLDTRIIAEYDRMVMNKRGNSKMKKKLSMPRVVIIALVVAILCGFAYSGSKFLYSDSKGHFSIRLQSNEAFSLDPITLEKARNSIKVVQAQLAPGETAVVYHPEVFSQFPVDIPIIGVSNLEYIYDAQQWKAVLEEQNVTESVPQSLLAGTYEFEAGAINSPFYSMMGMDAMDLLDEMKVEKKNVDEDKPLWRLTDIFTLPDISVYTTVYRDTNGEALYFTWQIYNDSSMKVESFTSPSTEYEEFNLDGKKIHYVKINESLFGDSTVFQSVMWMEEKGDATIVYSIESDSVTMTKEKLTAAVTSLP